jgi:hypothetical protein
LGDLQALATRSVPAGPRAPTSQLRGQTLANSRFNCQPNTSLVVIPKTVEVLELNIPRRF